MSGSLESVRSNIATQSIVSPVGVEVAASRREGHYRGESVRSSHDSASKLSNAASKTRTDSPSQQQRVDLRTQQIRSVRQGQGTNPQATARIADYHDKLPDMPSEDRLQALADEFQTVMTQMPPMHLTEHVGKHVAEQLHGQQQARENKSETADASEELQKKHGDASDYEGTGREAGSEEDAPTAFQQAVDQARDQILSLLQRFDGDVTHQFAALDILAEQFESDGVSDAFRLALDEARQRFEEPGIARDVRAGLAAAQIATRAAATLETDPATVRNVYRDLLRSQPNLGSLFDQLARFNVGGKLQPVIDTFLEVAGRDLGNTTQSTEPAFLHGLMSELSKLKTMNTVLDQAGDLIRLVERTMVRSERGQLDSTRLASAMLHFAAKTGPTPRDARDLLSNATALSPQSRVMLGNGLREMHALVPDNVIPSPQARMQQNAAIIGLLDQLVDEEERHHETG